MTTLVKMVKDGILLDVHPMVVEEHKKLGWVVLAEEKKQPAEKATKEPAEPANAPKADAKTTGKKNK